MEMYLLDSLLRRVDVVDKYESLIWTERYSDLGDFELVIHSTRNSRSQFLEGTKVAINKSYRVMTVKTVEDTVDDEGKAVLKVTGKSLEDILQDRAAKDTLSDLAVEPNWILTGLPADIAREMFDHICRDGALDPSDIIPFLQPGTIFAAGNIPEPTTAITWTQEPNSLFDAIQKLCTTYDLGFRLVRNFDASQLYFDIYSGSDRTTKQSILPPVIFAPNFDNMKNTTEFKTIQDSKNVAYVFSEYGWMIVYPDNVDPADVTGFNRHVLYVNASDITADTINVAGALEQAGKEALAGARTLSAFDGELAVSNFEDDVNYVKNLMTGKNLQFLTDDMSDWVKFAVNLTWIPSNNAARMTITGNGLAYIGQAVKPVIPGVTYTWSFDIMPEPGAESVLWTPVFNWYAADGVTLVRQDLFTWPGTALGSMTDFVRKSATAIAPAGAASVSVFIASAGGGLGKALQVRKFQFAEGEITEYVAPRPFKTGSYKYGTDYDLGDLVELRNVDGVITPRRVSEQIFVHDAEGERSYPTLMANDFIMAGTWLTAGDKVWEDFTTEYWEDM